MALTNQSKPSTSLANASKVSIGETWGSILTTWASETRTWLAVSQLFSNDARTNQTILWAATSFPWLMPTPWTSASGITNQLKP